MRATAASPEGCYSVAELAGSRRNWSRHASQSCSRVPAVSPSIRRSSYGSTSSQPLAPGHWPEPALTRLIAVRRDRLTRTPGKARDRRPCRPVHVRGLNREGRRRRSRRPARRFESTTALSLPFRRCRRAITCFTSVQAKSGTATTATTTGISRRQWASPSHALTRTRPVNAARSARP